MGARTVYQNHLDGVLDMPVVINLPIGPAEHQVAHAVTGEELVGEAQVNLARRIQAGEML